MTPPETISSRPNPYVGTRPYNKGETLYGRERETSELLDLLIAERIVMLYSPSGAGKSSMLNASVLPKMEENGFDVLPVVRLNIDPPENITLPEEFNRYIFSMMVCMEEVMPAEQRFSVEKLCDMHLKNYLLHYRERAAQINPDYDPTQAVLLVVDQGEEVITIAPTERQQKQAMFAQLGELLRDRSVWLLYSLREDFIARMDSYIKPIPTGFATRYRLTLLQADSALSAIQRPPETQGVMFTDEAAHKLSNDLRMMQVQQPDGTSITEAGLYVEPIQLQVVCRHLWSSLERTDNEIGVDDLEKIGDVNAALADYYATQVLAVAGKAGVQERFIRAWFDRKLITPQGIRGQVLLAPMKSDGLENTVIYLLEKTYLIRSEKRGGSTWFELAHDRLLAPIIKNNAEWFEQNLSALERQADVWNQEARPHGMLVTGPDFLKMQSWVESNRAQMSQIEVDFFNESKQAYQAEQREKRNNLIIRWMFAASAVGLMVTIVLFFRARIAEQQAIARELAAAATSNLSTDPELSILLALSSQKYTGTISNENIQALHLAIPAVQVEHTLTGHSDEIYAISMHPDGKTLASGSKDGSVKIWDMQAGKELRTLQIVEPSADRKGVTNVTYSPDGKTLAIVTYNGMLLFYDTGTWQEIDRVTAHNALIWGMAYTHDGNLIATGAEDGTIKLWDAHSKTLLNAFDIKDCTDRTICAENQNSKVNTLTFNHDGKLLAVAGSDSIIRVWDVTSRKFAFAFSNKNAHTGEVWMLAFNPNGKQIASVSTDRLVKIWDVASHEWVMDITGHNDWVYAVAYSPDGKRLITAGADRIIRIWDTTYGRLLDSLPGHTGQIFDLIVSADGKYLASACEDATIRIWNITKAGNYEIHTLMDDNKVNTVAYSLDNRLFATGGHSQKIKIWDENQGTLLKTLSGHHGVVEGLAWSPDAKLLVSTSRDGTAIVWDVESGTQRLVFDKHKKAIWDVAVSTDGSLTATGGSDGIVYIWDMQTGTVLNTLKADNGDVYAISISPDKKWLAVGYQNRNIIIWNISTGKPQYTLSEQITDSVQNVRFSHNGNILASVGDDGNLFLWDMKSNPPALLSKTPAHRGTVFALAFSHDDKFVLTGGADMLIRQRDISNPKIPRLAGTYYGFTDRVQSLDANHQNGHILSSGTDGTIRIFTLDTDELVSQAKNRLTREMSETECQDYLKSTCEKFAQTNLLQQLTIKFSEMFKNQP